MASLYELKKGEGIEFDRILDKAGVSAERARAVIRNPKLAVLMVAALEKELGGSRDTFTVDVRYSLPLAKAITRCKFNGYVNPNITRVNFPPTPGMPKRATLEVHLLHLNRSASTDEVLAEMESQNLRPLWIEELLALAHDHPNLQRQVSIVGLASRWRDSDGRWSVPCLFGDPAGRLLSLGRIGYGWGEICRFAAVCK